MRMAFYTAMHIISGRGAVWLARLTGGQEVAGSSPVAPTGWTWPTIRHFGYPPTVGGALGNPQLSGQLIRSDRITDRINDFRRASCHAVPRVLSPRSNTTSPAAGPASPSTGATTGSANGARPRRNSPTTGSSPNTWRPDVSGTRRPHRPHPRSSPSIPVEQEPAEIRRAPVFPLTASDAGGYVFDERLHLVLQFVKLPCIHGRKHDDKTDLAQDQLTL
jgi:hypothetical protein